MFCDEPAIKVSSIVSLFLGGILVVNDSAANTITEFESSSLLQGAYAGVIDSPFNGVALYANDDSVSFPSEGLIDQAGQYSITVAGASSNGTAASVHLLYQDQVYAVYDFTSSTVQNITKTVDILQLHSNASLTFELRSDTGSNDTLLDNFNINFLGAAESPNQEPEIPRESPNIPSTGSFDSGLYRNLFVEAGYSANAVTQKVTATYDQLFHGADGENERIFHAVGDDMAYIWDVGNNDVRSEGMSYGMMMALQMDRKSDFDKLWLWANTYMLNTEGDMKGYFAWQVSTDGKVLDKNPAPDGEEYFATALFFAAHRWGSADGVFDYKAQANKLLDDMFANGQLRYNNKGIQESFSLFNHEHKQIVFSPATPSDRNWTDPSYHLPAFYELWALWADNNNDFWREIAQVSRDFLATTVNLSTGLNPDYAYFDGTPHGDFQSWKNTFQYDAWRTLSNAALDYSWWQKDPWQIDYAHAAHNFFESEGINSYASLYELNGERYVGGDGQPNMAHSPGLVAMNAVGALASSNVQAWEFVDAFWQTPIPSGKWRYYDGSLYMLGMLAVSGNYKIYCPQMPCTDNGQEEAQEPTDTAPDAPEEVITLGAFSVLYCLFLGLLSGCILVLRSINILVKK